MRNLKDKICQRCGKQFKPTGACQKVCAECREAHIKEHAHENHVKRYVRKGYNQKRENNNSWRGGIGVFTEIAFEHYPKICMRCRSTKYICVHHRDRNRRNNDISNLEVLCKSCHQKEHDAGHRPLTLSAREHMRERLKAFALSRTDLERDEKGRFKKKSTT